MKKMYLMTILVCTLLNGCAYNPIIDTAGKSGTFNTDQAKEITNDLQHCKTVADQNSSFWGGVIFWIESQYRIFLDRSEIQDNQSACSHALYSQ